MSGVDPLAKGVLRFKQHGVEVELATADGLFSTATIDPGTRFLLRRVAEPDLADAGSVLDVGCGYGPLALWLAAARPGRTVAAVDRDALAVEVTAANAVRNRLADVHVGPSLGYDGVDALAPFDLVVSNIPAKVGPEALRHLVFEAPGRTLAIVVVDRLVEPVGELLADLVGSERVERRVTKGYATFVAELPAIRPRAEAGFDRGVYGRGRRDFDAAGFGWSATTSFSLPEFDTLSRATVCAAVVLAATPVAGRVGVVGTGPGHLARIVELAGAVPVVIDRDLLALRTTAANLATPAPDLRHTARVVLDGCDAAVVALPEKQPVASTAALVAAGLAALPSGAPVVLHGRAVDVGRVLDLLKKHRRRPKPQVRHAIGGYAAVRFPA